MVRLDGDQMEPQPNEELKPETPAPPPMSPLTPGHASLNEGDEPTSALKRPFELLSSDEENGTKRVCPGDDLPTHISDNSSQEGKDSGSPETNEVSTPLSEPGECSHDNKDEQTSTLKPEVWANLRGGLCEALPYFRAYKGSLQTQDRTAMGFLVDKEASVRDVFGSQIIISSV